MAWFKHFHEDDAASNPIALTTQNEYQNHYNERLNRCYALVLNTRMLTKSLCALNTMSLVDVNENNQVGDYFKNCKSPTPLRCSVAGQICNLEDNFKDLAAPYLTD